MEAYIKNEVVEFAVRFIGKPCVYIENNLEHDDSESSDVWSFICSELIRLYSPEVQYTNQYMNIVSSVLYGGMIAFDTEEEQKKFYSIFMNKEVYGNQIYAVAYDKDGNAMDENT
jgi:hypothetical protein